ncbi:hypothetical protein MCEMSE15_01755 [Fimbriimonadaceae bacterium]
MRKRQLSELVMVTIPKPCGESWDAMVGGEDKRLCAGCGCHVHNLAGMPASEVEALMQAETTVCTRIMADPVKGILTRDGWVSRLVLTGAIAAGMAGCTDPVVRESAIGKVAVPVESSKSKGNEPVMGAVAAEPAPTQVMGERDEIVTIGKLVAPQPKPKKK